MTVHSRFKVSSSLSSSSPPSLSAEIVGSIDDLLVEILLLLPVKLLVRFQSVSKKWKSLITSPCFSFRHGTGLSPSPCPCPATGMFLCGPRSTAFNYLHFDVQNPSHPRFNELSFPEDPYTFSIHHPSKGLLLCCSPGSWRSPVRICYILNPTLNLYVKLPRPGVTNGVPRYVLGVTLAFDPAQPPYRVLCVRGSEFAIDLSQIEIYSTETGQWSLVGKPFRAEVDFQAGVYWNGSVHWVNYNAYEILYFDINQENFGTLSLPEASNYHRTQRIGYLGESHNKLQLVLIYDESKLTVYEMERDTGKSWSAKYHVHLRSVVDAFPGTVSDDHFVIDSTNAIGYKFSILYVVRGNEAAFLVMKIANKVVRFNLERHGLQEILELKRSAFEHHLRAFEYIQSLCMFRCPMLNGVSG